ncbi:MAG TPA: response regulator transcription factor [Pyrinomonadaceae bacterium]
MEHPELRELTILLIDDSDTLRKRVKNAFAIFAGFQVIGEAATGREAIEMARSLRPDLIVFEPSSATTGIHVLREIRRHDLRVLIAVFTTDYSAAMRETCRDSGATFFINKSRIRDLLDISELARKCS